MNNQIIIASDSTCDLGPELISRYNIQILPLRVSLSDQEYTDGVDIDPEMIYSHYEKTKTLPKTAAISIGNFTDFFRPFVEAGKSVVMFTISSEMSSTYQNGCIAASEFENVHIVDTRNLSTGGGLLVIRAAELAAEGKSAEEIAEHCRALTDRVDASFVIDSLEFLHKGGRCSAVAAFGANLLSLKPCIVVRDGKMGVAKKYRGNFQSVVKNYIRDQIGDASAIEPEHVFVTHAGCDPQLCEEWVALVKELGNFKEVHLTRAGCTISSHCGRNTMGVLFIRKSL